MTVRAVLAKATGQLGEAGIETARLDAEILLSHVLGCARMSLYGKPGTPVSVAERDMFQALVNRRITKEPVAYLTGAQEFWSLPFKVTPDTLIPRPDTETLIEVVLARLKETSAPAILDLGTGSGCILVSLLTEIKTASGFAVDLSHKALDVAQGNAVALGVADRADFIQGSWFDPLGEQQPLFDVIVSNPPYIPTNDLSGLMSDVKDFEPVAALDGGTDGLAPYRLIAGKSPDFLKPEGLLAVEVGIHQAQDVAALFSQNGLVDVTVSRDLGGIERVVSGKISA